MKKFTLLSAFFLCTVWVAFGQEPSESLEGKIILKLKNNTSLSDSVRVDVQNKTGNYKIDEINLLHQSISVTKQQLGRKTNKYIYIIKFPFGTILKPIIDAYYETGEIEYAEPDYTGTLGGAQEVVPNDQYHFRQWGLHNDGTFPPGLAVAGADLDMQNAWDIELGDSSIIVGILDTGVKFDHPELAGRTWINYNEIPNNLIDDDANGYIDDVKGWNFANSNNNPVDGHGHGTNITGIVGANSNNTIGYSGVDWNCKLMILKGFTDSGGGNVSWWADAIYYAVDNGARIVNMSFGITNNSITLEDAVNYALENNVVLVACMMNDNSNTVYYPAAYTGVIAVGSTDWDDTRSQPFPWNPNSGSNWGDHISVVAPGNVIFGLDYLSNTNYEIYFSGTSQATANVSGVASLLLAQDPERTPGDIKYILEATAEDTIGDPIEDIPGWDPYYGFGRVNAYYALLSSQPCLPEGITFSTQEEIDNFQTNYPGCTEIEGYVTINGSPINNLNGLNVLTSIGGNFEIDNVSPLVTLTGLDALTFIGGGLAISGTEITDLTGLGSLTSIGGYFRIGRGGMFGPGNPYLTTLTGLEALTTISGILIIQRNPSLTSLTGLSNLISVGSLRIIENNAITSLTGLDNIDEGSIDYLGIYGNNSLASCDIQGICDYLSSPNGSVNIFGNATGCNNPSEVAMGCGISLPCLPYGNYYFINQADVDNFQSNYPACTELSGNVLIGIDEEWYLSITSDISNLNGLLGIISIEGRLWITTWNNGLTTLAGLDSLNSVGGEFYITDNYALANLASMDGLISIGGGLTIYSNNSLTSLTGLDNIDTNSIESINIQWNSSLSNCDVLSICDYLASPGGIVEIEDNAPGCNSPEEVEAACLTSVEEIIPGNGFTITPNPSYDKTTISIPALYGDTQLSIFNVSGEKVLEKQLIETETQLDISALPQGVYFVRVQNEKMVEVAKMIKE